MSDVDELGRRLLDVALLEGDFTLRSGKRSRWYLDKYRFETEPALLRALGERLAAAARDAEPEAARLAGPALGAVALAASASMATRSPRHSAGRPRPERKISQRLLPRQAST